MTSPKVVVLILSYNGKSLLQEAVSSYLNCKYSNFEVVVVDNGSTDGTADYVATNFPGVILHRTEKNLKYSGGLNFGMEFAFGSLGADYALITNNDVKAHDAIIQSLVDVATTNAKIAFTIGKVYYYDSPDIFQTVGKRFHPIYWNGGHIGQNEHDSGQYDLVEERAWCDDIYWLVSSEIWKLTAGYDTEFAFQGEDFDWQIRAKNLGYKIMYAPNAKLWHKESMTIGKSSPFKAYYDARNPLIIHMKYRSRTEYLKMIRMKVAASFKSTPKWILKLRLRIALNTWRGVASAIIWGLRNSKLP